MQALTENETRKDDQILRPLVRAEGDEKGNRATLVQRVSRERGVGREAG